MITVQTNHDECEPFDKNRIENYCINQIGLEEKESKLIALSVWRKYKDLHDDTTVTTAMLREDVNVQLRKRGYMDESRKHERVGIPFAEIREYIRGHNCDNANLQRNPETFHKNVADYALKQYALECLPKDIAEAHNKGEMHIHDLEYFPGRPINCLQHDLRWIIQNIFKPDGIGEHTSTAHPAKHFPTLMNHAGEMLLAGQQNCSGGQGFSLFNVFASPFVRGLTFKQIKQGIQMFIYNLNMAYSNRGGQVPFTSVNLEFTVPDFLKDEIAWGPGGEPCGVYGGFEEETRLINRAFIEVLMEGDAMGKPHLFPNTIWVLREEMMTEEFDEDFKRVCELSSKYSTPYFANCIPEWTGKHSNVMGCRTRLNTNWTGDWDVDTLRTGNLAYITINFPRIAYKSNGKAREFYKELDRVLEIATRTLLIRRRHAEKLLNEYNMLPFLAQKNKDGETYYRIENSTLSFGVIGMDEMLRAFWNDKKDGGMYNEKNREFVYHILDYLNQYAKKLTEETGYRWTIFQTPGETTANRFATLDKKHFPDKAIYKGGVREHKLLDEKNEPNIWVEGEEGSEYYTNSTHIPVDETRLLLTQKMQIEAEFHPLTSGGHIFHAWIGEAYTDPVAIMKLTKAIATKTDLGFWAYTSAFSYCFNCCTFLNGMQYKCPECGSSDDIEHYSRITGYVQQVGAKKDSIGGWNKGKRAELRDRYEHGDLSG